MVDLSEEPKEENIELTKKYFKRAAPMKQWLEMEIGITGGEEDGSSVLESLVIVGVDNTAVDNASLYTQPEDIWDVYRNLAEIGPYFSIAAAFGNVHGVYKPDNVRLHPELLGKHQAYTREQLKCKDDKPLYLSFVQYKLIASFLVFHGGSGSTKEEYDKAISFGVVKVNLDTDLQYAYCAGIRDYMISKKAYLLSQVGNPDGEDKPNKKYFDPRVWVREGEKIMSKRVKEALEDFKTAGKA